MCSSWKVSLDLSLFILKLKSFVVELFHCLFLRVSILGLRERAESEKYRELESIHVFLVLRALVYVLCCKVVHTLVRCFSKCCDTGCSSFVNSFFFVSDHTGV